MRYSGNTYVLTSTLLGIALCSHALGADWPQWLGPHRTGKSPDTGLAKQWPATGPKLAWKTKGVGNGYSTVSVVGDSVFTTGDRGDASFIVALNRKDGKEQWATKLGKAGAPGWGGFAGPRATPTVAGDSIFAVNQWGEMICVSAKDGAEKWRKDFGKDFDGPRPEWGFSESPLADGNQVVVTPGGDKGAIVALDKKTGAVLWRTTDFTDPAHYSSIIEAEIGGVKQYVQLTASTLVGVSPKDGKVLWRAPRKGETAVITTPIYDNGYIYVSSGYGVGCNLFKVSSEGGKFKAEQVYANKIMVNHHGGVIKSGDYVYGYSDSKGWTCQNFKSGEAKWQDKDKLGKGSLVYADGMFILRQEDKQGTVALIEASPEGYKEHGRFDQPERTDKNSWSHPVVIDGKLYIRDQDLLLCYDLKS